MLLSPEPRDYLGGHETSICSTAMIRVLRPQVPEISTTVSLCRPIVLTGKPCIYAELAFGAVQIVRVVIFSPRSYSTFVLPTLFIDEHSCSLPSHSHSLEP